MTGGTKSKMKLQVASVIIEKYQESESVTCFQVETASDLIAKLNFASKFCSIPEPGKNVSSIHCTITQDLLSIKATTGAILYDTSIDIKSENEAKIYIPKKAPAIIKNIYHDVVIEKCTIYNRSIQFESSYGKLTVYLEAFQDDDFPEQIMEWKKKPSDAKIKASIFEITKTLKFFNLMYTNTRLSVDEGKLNLQAAQFETKDVKDSQDEKKGIASKEQILVEECTGKASSDYPVKSLIECLEALQAIWVNLEFINMGEDLFICKLTHGNTVILLCPLIS